MSTPTAPSPIFNAQERVLCYHGPLIYEAKVLKTKSSDDTSAANGGPGPRYLVHYKGWKQTYVLSLSCVLFSPFPLLFCSLMPCLLRCRGRHPLFFYSTRMLTPPFFCVGGTNGSPRAACSSSPSRTSRSRRPSSKPTPPASTAAPPRPRRRARPRRGTARRTSARAPGQGRTGRGARNGGGKRCALSFPSCSQPSVANGFGPPRLS
jgi:hypothetical protein